MIAAVEPLSLEEGPGAFRTNLAARGFADKTQEAYAGDVAGFVSYLRLRTVLDRWDEVALRHLEGFLAELDRAKRTGSTRHRKAIALRSFFSFLEEAGVVASNVTLKLIAPQSEDPAPQVLTRSECRRLLDAAADDVRDTAIMALFLETGMGLSELATLRIDAVTLSGVDVFGKRLRGTVHIAAKGHRDRTLGLPDLVCNAVEAYLAVRPPVYDPTLFLTKFGRAMSPRAVERLVEKHLTTAGILGATVHTLRHTFAVNRVRSGTDLETLQAMLGHESAKVTQRYLELAEVMRLRELRVTSG